ARITSGESFFQKMIDSAKGNAENERTTTNRYQSEDSPMSATRCQNEPRRELLKTSAVAGGALPANLSLLSNVHAAGEDIIRVGLVGCGGRGSGAIEQCIRGGRNVRVVALGDAFRDRADGLRNSLRNLAQN